VIEPGADRAAGESTNKKIVVIGTEATVSSHAYRKALEDRGAHAKEKACPLLVPLVEEGWIDHPVTEEVAHIYLKEAFADEFKSADVLLLGCTHYPLIQPVLRRVAPKHVKIVDSADAVGRLLRRAPLPSAPETERRRLPRLRYFATDSAEKFRRLGAQFLGQPIDDVRHANLAE
jgi:glutamate racemase